MSDPRANWTARGWIYIVGAVSFLVMGVTWHQSPRWWEIVYRVVMFAAFAAFGRMAYYALWRHEAPAALIRRRSSR